MASATMEERYVFRKVSVIAGVLALIGAMTIPVASAARAVQLSAQLDGASEVPGPGDANGEGEIFVGVKMAVRKVCFSLSFKKIGPPEAGHIHRGGPAVAGPVVVELFSDPAGLSVPGAVDGCVRHVRPKLLRRLANNPQRFYVNLHNDPYPGGAIRGQLGPAF